MKATNQNNAAAAIKTPPPSEEPVFLRQYLGVFEEFLFDPTVSEVCVNKPGEAWVERIGAPHMECHANEKITNEMLWRLGRLVANYTSQEIAQDAPLLSASLPSGERIQFAMPPAARHGVALSIRKQVIANMSLGDYVEAGAFENTVLTNSQKKDGDEEKLKELLSQNKLQDFLSLAIQCKKNILISGGTSTGKTTLLNALLKEIDKKERIITIEDTPEVSPPHKNHLSMLASKGEQGNSKITIQNLLEASLRFRPDRILLGELRGAEAYSFLRAVNTGHPGTITTIHSDTPRSAFEQICLMVMQGDNALTHDQIMAYTKSIIDIVVQLKRTGGRRHVSEIWYPQKEGLA